MVSNSYRISLLLDYFLILLGQLGNLFFIYLFMVLAE